MASARRSTPASSTRWARPRPTTSRFVAATTGPTNLMATVVCRDVGPLHTYLTRRLASLSGVRTTETTHTGSQGLSRADVDSREPVGAEGPSALDLKLYDDPGTPLGLLGRSQRVVHVCNECRIEIPTGELNCYDCDRVRAELVEANAVTVHRYWPRQLCTIYRDSTSS